MERPVIVDTSRTFISDASVLRDFLTTMLEVYSGDPINDPQWLHETGHSYGHVRKFRLGVHRHDANDHFGQEAIAWTCDLLLHRSIWIDNGKEAADLANETKAIYEAVGIIAYEFGHNMTYDNTVIFDDQSRSARMRYIEDPDGPLIPQIIMDTLTSDLPSLRYLSSESGNRKNNVRFGSSEPPYIPRVKPSDTPVLDRVSLALSCIDPLRRMELIAHCEKLLETKGIANP